MADSFSQNFLRDDHILKNLQHLCYICSDRLDFRFRKFQDIFFSGYSSSTSYFRKIHELWLERILLAVREDWWKYLVLFLFMSIVEGCLFWSIHILLDISWPCFSCLALCSSCRLFRRLSSSHYLKDSFFLLVCSRCSFWLLLAFLLISLVENASSSIVILHAYFLGSSSKGFR